jgi:SOS response regulatory protein OraA/RecX
LKQKLREKFSFNSLRWKKYGWISDEEIDYIVNKRLRGIITEEEVIKSKIRFYKSKWKSTLYIKQKLYERQEPKELIEKFLDLDLWFSDEENLKKEYEKLKKKFDEKKIIEKLLMKWFMYDDVKRVIKQLYVND